MDHSLLNNLPPELRNCIYEFAFSEENADDLPILITSPEPALMRTCKQIRGESVGIFYSRWGGFHTPIARADMNAQRGKFEEVFQKWISTRQKRSDGDRLHCVQLLCVSQVMDDQGYTLRGWHGRSFLVEDVQVSQLLDEAGFTSSNKRLQRGDDAGGASVVTCYWYREKVPDVHCLPKVQKYFDKLQSA